MPTCYPRALGMSRSSRNENSKSDKSAGAREQEDRYGSACADFDHARCAERFETARYYEEFGLTLTPGNDGQQRVLAPTDGGQQMTLVHAPQRRLLEMTIGADDQDDLNRIERKLDRLDASYAYDGETLRVSDPNSAILVTVQVVARIPKRCRSGPTMDRAGLTEQTDEPGLSNEMVVFAPAVGPRGHRITRPGGIPAFFTEGLGFMSAIEFPVWHRSSAAPPTITIFLIQQAPLNFCTTPPGRSTMLTKSDVERRRCLRGTGAPCWVLADTTSLELLLVPQGPGGKLFRVLLRFGLHRRRPNCGSHPSWKACVVCTTGPSPVAFVLGTRRPRALMTGNHAPAK